MDWSWYFGLAMSALITIGVAGLCVWVLCLFLGWLEDW